MLFPPMTLLKVNEKNGKPERHEETTDKGITYTRIVVSPTFI